MIFNKHESGELYVTRVTSRNTWLKTVDGTLESVKKLIITGEEKKTRSNECSDTEAVRKRGKTMDTIGLTVETLGTNIP